MSVDVDNSRTRRNLLAAGLGGLAATVATAIGRPQLARAANGDPVLAGTPNTASAATTLTNSAANGVGFTASSGAAGQFAAVGIHGSSASGTGAEGVTNDGTGVYGEGYWGVYGTGAAGVVGDVDAGSGVMGWTGVNPAPAPPVRVGVFAGAENGRLALFVSGQARFSRSGRASVAAGRSSVAITVPGGINSRSFGIATPQTNRAGVYVQAVVPNATNGTITIYLNKVPSTTTATAVGWMVLQ